MQKKSVRKRFRKFIIIASICLISILLLRGFIYRKAITYKSVKQRNSIACTNPELIQEIEEYCNSTTNPTTKEIIRLSLSFTASNLTFSTGSNPTNLNLLIKVKETHCVGYASMCAGTCNYLFNKYDPSSDWEAKHMVGELFLFGNNIHKYFNTPFFRDHDFVLMENKSTGEKIAIDPSLYDYLRISYVNYSNLDN